MKNQTLLRFTAIEHNLTNSFDIKRISGIENRLKEALIRSTFLWCRLFFWLLRPLHETSAWSRGQRWSSAPASAPIYRHSIPHGSWTGCRRGTAWCPTLSRGSQLPFHWLILKQTFYQNCRLYQIFKEQLGDKWFFWLTFPWLTYRENTPVKFTFLKTPF